MIRPRPPGFSPWVCLRRASEECFSPLANPSRNPSRGSIRANSQFRSVFSKYVYTGKQSYNPRSQVRLSTMRRSKFSTLSRRYAQSETATEEDQIDLSAVESPGEILPANIEKLTVNELKELLAHRSLKTSGKKSELIARLYEFVSPTGHTINTTTQQTSRQVTPEPDSKFKVIPDRLHFMNVKELKARLVELGLPTTGLKSQLIERLAKHEQNHPLPDIEIVEVDCGSIQDEGDVVSSESTNQLPRSTVGAEAVSEADVSKDSSTLPSIIPSNRLPTAIASYPNVLLDYARPEEFTPNESINELKPPVQEVETRLSHDFSINLLLEDLYVAEVHSRVLAMKLTISRLRSTVALLPAAPTRMPVVYSEIEQASVLPSTDSNVPNVPSLPPVTLKAIQNRLYISKMQIKSLTSEAKTVGRNVKGPPEFLYNTSSETPASEEESNDLSHQRSMSLGKMYFSKAFDLGINSNPSTTSNMRLVEFPSESIISLRKYFLRNVNEITRHGKKPLEADFAQAWEMALEEFASGPGTPYIYVPVPVNADKDRTSKPVMWKGVENEADHSTKAQPSVTTTKPVESHTREAESIQLSSATADINLPLSTKSDSLSQDNNLLFDDNIDATGTADVHILGGVSTRNIPGVGNVFVQSRSGRPLWDHESLRYPAWRARFLEYLSGTPVTIDLTIDDHQRRRFLMRPPSEHILGAFLTNGDPHCQIFNSMWLRLGLMDHIQAIRPGNTNLDYSVTFKSFEAAAAFVNRSNEHWLEDQISGQVYATWRPEGPPRSIPIATLILPRASIEVWRRVALEHNVRFSKYGLPVVDWGRSFQSVLQRMRMTLGRDGECRWYKVASEYAHRIVIAVCFKDAESLEKFMLLKKEHCLTSPWKDRFFVKGRGVKYETSISS
jgi:hypothetical protein